MRDTQIEMKIFSAIREVLHNFQSCNLIGPNHFENRPKISPPQPDRFSPGGMHGRGTRIPLTL